MTRKLMYISLLAGWLAAMADGYAQQKSYVVEKVVNKVIPLSPAESLKIVGEKAGIKVKGWEKDYLQLTLTFSAKHPDKALAEKELAYMKYALSKEGNRLEIRNTFFIPEEVSRTQSSMEVNYELQVPMASNIEISAKYGDVTLTDLKGKLTLAIEFGDVQLTAIDAEVKLEALYGEIRGNRITGSFFCKSNKSDIYLDSFQGVYTGNSSLGSITLLMEEKYQGVQIKASRTNVTLNLRNLEAYTYDLHTTHASIHVPDRVKKLVKASNSGNTSLRFMQRPTSPLIKVTTTFSPITIRTNL